MTPELIITLEILKYAVAGYAIMLGIIVTFFMVGGLIRRIR